MANNKQKRISFGEMVLYHIASKIKDVAYTKDGNGVVLELTTGEVFEVHPVKPDGETFLNKLKF